MKTFAATVTHDYGQHSLSKVILVDANTEEDAAETIEAFYIEQGAERKLPSIGVQFDMPDGFRVDLVAVCEVDDFDSLKACIYTLRASDYPETANDDF